MYRHTYVSYIIIIISCGPSPPASCAVFAPRPSATLIYIYIYVCIHICIYVYTYIHIYVIIIDSTIIYYWVLCHIIVYHIITCCITYTILYCACCGHLAGYRTSRCAAACSAVPQYSHNVLFSCMQ